MPGNNRRRLTQHARELRRDQTRTEHKLWSRLRKRQLLGHKFRRQHVLGNYIVDFICLERRLVLELDGAQHLEPQALSYDQARTRWLNQQGFAVLRFFDNQVLSELDAVLSAIGVALQSPPPDLPRSFVAGEETILSTPNPETSLVGKLRMVTPKTG